MQCPITIVVVLYPSPQIHEALFHGAGPTHDDSAVLVVVNLVVGSMLLRSILSKDGDPLSDSLFNYHIYE